MALGCPKAAGQRAQEQCPFPRKPPTEWFPRPPTGLPASSGLVPLGWRRALLQPPSPQWPEGSRLSLHSPDSVYRALEEVRVPGNAQQDSSAPRTKPLAQEEGAARQQLGGSTHTALGWTPGQCGARTGPWGRSPGAGASPTPTLLSLGAQDSDTSDTADLSVWEARAPTARLGGSVHSRPNQARGRQGEAWPKQTSVGLVTHSPHDRPPATGLWQPGATPPGKGQTDWRNGNRCSHSPPFEVNLFSRAK